MHYFLYKKNYKSNYTYRFVLLPETIGSIAYISKKASTKSHSGYVLTCVGDERSYSIVHTPDENTIADFL